MMRSRSCPAWALLFALSAATPSSLAQPASDDDTQLEAGERGGVSEDFSDLESLLGEQVVTTASRSAERASAAPATVVSIDSDTMRRYGMRSLDEVLNYLGLGTYLVDSGRDYTSGVDTGVQGVLLRTRNRHVLVMVDGHVMNAQSTGEARLDVALGIPLEIIDHVELMLGPGSVSYGSNAMMAVINIVTRSARDYGQARFVGEGTLDPPLGPGSSLDAGGDARFGGRYRLGAGFARTGTVLGRSAELMAHFEWQQELSSTYEVPIQTGNFDIEPGEPGWGGHARFRMRSPSAYLRARIGNTRLWFQGNSYYRTTPLLGVFDDPTTREKLSQLRGELRNDAVLTPVLTLTSRLYGAHARLDETSVWMRSIFCLPGQLLDGCSFQRRNGSSWVGVEEQLVADWKLDGRFVTTFGGDLRFRYGVARPADYFDRATGDPPFTVRLPYWSSRSVLGALFVQQLMRPIEQLTINVGARFDGDSLYGVRLSPRAAIMYLPTSRTTVRVGYSEAFRAPSAQELEDTDPTYIIRPLSLRAETVRSLDVELAQRFSKGGLSVRGFLSRYSGLVALRSVTQEEFDAANAAGTLVPNAELEGVAVWDNSEVIRVAGGTLSARYEPVEGLELATNLTYAVNDVGGAGSLPIMPRFYGNARIAYRFGPRAPTLALVAAFTSNRVGVTETGEGPYLTLPVGPEGNVRLVGSGPIGGDSGLRWSATIHTSFNGRNPYVFSAGPTAEDPGNTLVYGPVQRLFFFAGVQYDLR